jgi:hypothetical protein
MEWKSDVQMPGRVLGKLKEAWGPEKDVAVSKQERPQAARVAIATELRHGSASWRTQGRTAQGREGGGMVRE